MQWQRLVHVNPRTLPRSSTLYYTCDVVGVASAAMLAPSGTVCVAGALVPSSQTTSPNNKCFLSSNEIYLAGQGASSVTCPANCAGSSCQAAYATPLPAPTPLADQTCPAGGSATFVVPTLANTIISGCIVHVAADAAGHLSFSNSLSGAPILCTFCGASCPSCTSPVVVTGLEGPAYEATVYLPVCGDMVTAPPLESLTIYECTCD